jgi:hypothetical protein
MVGGICLFFLILVLIDRNNIRATLSHTMITISPARNAALNLDKKNAKFYERFLVRKKLH